MSLPQSGIAAALQDRAAVRAVYRGRGRFLQIYRSSGALLSRSAVFSLCPPCLCGKKGTAYGVGASRKKLAGELFVTIMPMTGTPLLTVTQLVEARFVVLCKMKPVTGTG